MSSKTWIEKAIGKTSAQPAASKRDRLAEALLKMKKEKG
jgi:hypothetical protein